MGLLLCLVFFFKTTILDGHFGNRVRQEIVFTFGKGFKDKKKKTRSEAACDCGLWLLLGLG